MYIKVYPKKGKPYYFQKMIGKHTIMGTHIKGKAKHLTLQEKREVTALLDGFIKYEVIDYQRVNIKNMNTDAV